MGQLIERHYGSRGLHTLSLHPGIIPTNLLTDHLRKSLEHVSTGVVSNELAEWHLGSGHNYLHCAKSAMAGQRRQIPEQRCGAEQASAVTTVNCMQSEIGHAFFLGSRRGSCNKVVVRFLGTGGQ